MLKILKLVVVLFNMSYFVGMIFLIIADLNKTTHRSNEDPDHEHEAQEYFIEYYAIDSFDPMYTTIIAYYFALTSLSTVGFGDYNPRSNFERIFVSFMLVTGVAIFSFFMGVFIEILQGYESITAELEDYENLSKFICTLKSFNKGKPIKL